jgi:ornithine carbamoyltransferase
MQKKDFIDIIDYTPSELKDLLDLAVRLKAEHNAGGNEPVLRGKVLAMIFQKPSLRTRISFEIAMRHLGGDALYISPPEIGLGTRESVPDVAHVLEGYVDGIMARVFEHRNVTDLARNTRLPVINGLSDYSHPCQAMADMLTIFEKFGRTTDLNVVYVGDGNNVAVSLMQITIKMGSNFTIANPKGFSMPSEAVRTIRPLAVETGSKLAFVENPHEAVKGAHVIYTDTWVSMGQEEEAARREQIFPPYQVNKTLVDEANDDVIVMHCLPAHRNQEITDEVADGPHSIIFPEAHNRLHAQKAILYSLLKG